MKNLKLYLSIFLMCIIYSASSQNIDEIKASELKSRIKNGSDTTYIVNFWATWCAPCVKELPLFEQVNAQYSDKKIKVILVSLDFKKDIQNKLKNFIEKREIKSEVLFLNENDPNEWISQFTDQWEGAIPATLLYNSSKSINTFRSSAFEGNELIEFLKKEKIIED